MEKEDITPSLVAGLVASQFPEWAGLPVSPVAVDGWDNTTFRLGDSLAVRLPSADRYVAQVAKEHRWLPVLAPQLPLPIPVPVAQGRPGNGFPRPWSIYRWLPGEPARLSAISDLTTFATDLAGFLAALWAVDATGGPPPGDHNFLRGGPPATYDAPTREAIELLSGTVDAAAVTAAWESALASRWARPPVWVHGDVGPSNLLVLDGRLAAVIDFGCSGVGDPACDLVMAWTFFAGESRATFRAALPLDEDDPAWSRARGWALWKALLTLAHDVRGTEPAATATARYGWRHGPDEIIADLLADHARG